MEKGISDIVGVFTDPILVFPGGWGETLPQWLKNAITLERLEMNMRARKGEEMTGTDAEACAYLYTAGLTQPMDHDWSQIYLYIAGQVAKQYKKAELPQDIVVESISDYQMAESSRGSKTGSIASGLRLGWIGSERRDDKRDKRKKPGERRSNQCCLNSSWYS